eukprot:scaffold12132_cov153-Skeletonema_menzelii.AAC.4
MVTLIRTLKRITTSVSPTQHMSTTQSHVKKPAAPGHQNGEDDDDDVVGALICMDIHLRKAEAVTGTATAAAKSKSSNEKSSTLAQQVCTPKISPDNNLSDKSSPQRNIVKKRRIEECTSKEDQPRKKVAKKHYRYSDSEFLTDGCTNKEECALVTGQNSNYAAVMDAQIVSSEEEFALGWGAGAGQIAMLKMNLLHLGSEFEMTILFKLKPSPRAAVRGQEDVPEEVTIFCFCQEIMIMSV